jgi:hypothetical protein
MRAIGVLAAIILATLAGVAGASIVIPSGADTLGGPDRVQPDGNGATVSRGESDPGGGPRWAVRVYRSRTGAVCPEAGRFDGARFGRADASGRVTVLPISASGSCTDLTNVPYALVVNRYPAADGQGERTVVFGVATHKVRAIALTTGDGTRAVDIAPNGAFIAIEPTLDTSGDTVTVTADDGSTTEQSLTPRVTAP